MEEIGIGIIGFLILFPVLIALILLIARKDRARSVVTVIGALITAFASIFLAVEFLGTGTHYYALGPGLTEVINWVTLAIDVFICVYIVVKGLCHHNYKAVLLALAQGTIVVWAEFGLFRGMEATSTLYIDDLSIIMALIIGIIGCGICVYGLGYMRDHERHNPGKDRRPTFFAIMFVFLGAMFGIVFFNDLNWMLTVWEITTVCSFVLIGYTRTEEAIRNSFRQIVLNLIGGLCFAIALVWIGNFYGVIELDQFISMSLDMSAAGYTQITYLPLILLCIAGFTKAAQMPFQSWLLGAMVAPTPTSALLHSSTMVKAGVFLIIKLAPCLGFNIPGFVVMLVGGATFLFCSFAAISQTNAKRVLAYSTISNLGLIIACAGVGTDGALWAAIFLLIFHACAKSLLFLCVGTAEHHIGSRDIESMDDLFERMPRLARFMSIGILGMFIAPFGMLVSKWAALASFASSENVLLLLILAFGSAATFMFWAKWLGKILSVANSGAADVEGRVYRSEWSAIGLMTVLTVVACIGFPLISQGAVVPYLATVFEEVTQGIANSDLWIMAIIALVIAIIFLGFSGATRKKIVPVYMSGAGIDAQERTFKDSFSRELPATQRNMYLTDYFNEHRVTIVGIAVCLTLMLGSLAFVGQSVAAERDVVEAMPDARQVYEETEWSSSDEATYGEYLQNYEYYKEFYEENTEMLEEYYGLTSLPEVMDYVYEQTYATDYSSYYDEDYDEESYDEDSSYDDEYAYDYEDSGSDEETGAYGADTEEEGE
ncbi:MAG: hypothetical protein LUD25_05265 [Coriobacteriaceae bacterium]|nr:hypothetical protein [Coriobacteriaceae bacterium]